MSSQPTKVRTRSAEWTTRSMPAQNSDTVAANTAYRSSVRRYQAAKACTAHPTRATTRATSAGVALVWRSSGTSSPPASRAGRRRPVCGCCEPPAAARPTTAATTVASEAAIATSRAGAAPRRASSRPTSAARAGRSTTRRAAARLIARALRSRDWAVSGWAVPGWRTALDDAWLRSMSPRSRKTASTTASATQTSAAAMVITKRVSTLPACQVSAPTAPTATSRMLAALRISSTPMSTSTALRRARTP